MQEIDVELEAKEKKYLRGEGANLEVMICCFFLVCGMQRLSVFLLVLQTLKDKKLKTQLASREKLYGKSAKTAAKIEKVKVLLLQSALCGSCFYTFLPVLLGDECFTCG